MGWMGKLVGGTIGLALGGPLGAIAGAAFGHFFDQSTALFSGGISETPPDSLEDAQMTFFVAAFSMLAKLVQADGRVTEDEMAAVERFMQDDLRLSLASRKAALDIFHAARVSPHTFEDFAGQFYTAFRQRPEILTFMVDILMRVALSDREISASEETLVRSAARLFGVNAMGYQNGKIRHIEADDRYYRVLGLSREATDDDIKRRYRELAKNFHPDRIAAKGLPEEFTRFAADKFREIQEAYDAIRKERRAG